MIGWVRRKFSRKLALAFCITSVFTVAVTSFFLGNALRENFLSELSSSLATTAKVVETQIDKTSFARRDSRSLQEFAASLGRSADCRLTVIATDGTVLADSDVPY